MKPFHRHFYVCVVFVVHIISIFILVIVNDYFMVKCAQYVDIISIITYFYQTLCKDHVIFMSTSIIVHVYVCGPSYNNNNNSRSNNSNKKPRNFSVFIHIVFMRYSFPKLNMFAQTCIMMLFFYQRHTSKLIRYYLQGGMEIRPKCCKN